MYWCYQSFHILGIFPLDCLYAVNMSAVMLYLMFFTAEGPAVFYHHSYGVCGVLLNSSILCHVPQFRAQHSPCLQCDETWILELVWGTFFGRY